MTNEFYFTVWLVVWPIAWAVIAHHHWSEFDRPRPITFGSFFFGCAGGLLFAFLWPVSVPVFGLWIATRLMFWVVSHK